MSTGAGIFRRPVSELMSSDVVVIDPEADLTEVIDTLLEQHVGALPVTEPGTYELLGIVSYVDVLRAIRSREE